jgi:hypothetical protein
LNPSITRRSFATTLATSPLAGVAAALSPAPQSIPSVDEKTAEHLARLVSQSLAAWSAWLAGYWLHEDSFDRICELEKGKRSVNPVLARRLS